MFKWCLKTMCHNTNHISNCLSNSLFWTNIENLQLWMLEQFWLCDKQSRLCTINLLTNSRTFNNFGRRSHDCCADWIACSPRSAAVWWEILTTLINIANHMVWWVNLFRSWAQKLVTMRTNWRKATMVADAIMRPHCCSTANWIASSPRQACAAAVRCRTLPQKLALKPRKHWHSKADRLKLAFRTVKSFGNWWIHIYQTISSSESPALLLQDVFS